jgi:hypothetical protein
MFPVLLSQEENNKLSEELHNSVDQNTKMFEKVLMVRLIYTHGYLYLFVIKISSSVHLRANHNDIGVG